MVKTVADRQFPAGPEPAVLGRDGQRRKQVARGVYFTQVKFRNRNFTDAKKLVVLKQAVVCVNATGEARCLARRAL